MNKIILILVILISFTSSGQDVYLDKLQVPPSLFLSDNVLTFNTNRKDFFRKRLKIKVDKKKKEIYLTAVPSWPSRRRIFDFRLTLTLNLRRYRITDPTPYRFYWIDPDKKTTELDVRTNNKTFYPGPIFPFREGNEWFYVDSNLTKLNDKNFDFVYPFYFNYAVVKIKNKYALINKALELITQPIFYSLSLFH